MAAPYGLLYPGFMGQRFALPMQDDLSRLPPDRGLIEGDMPGRGPLPGPYELAAMRRPAPMGRPQPQQRRQAPQPEAMPRMMPAAPQASPQSAPAGPLGGLFAPENRDTLAALGIGLMRGDFAGGMSEALKMKQGRAQENATRAWLMKRGLSAEDAAMAAQNPSIMSMLLKPGETDKYAERAAAAKQYGLQEGTPEWQQFTLTGNLPSSGKDGPSSIQEYEYAVQHDGYKGSFTDWQTKSIREQDPTFGREKDLRAEFESSPIVKNYQVVRDNYERIRQGASLTTGAGDIAVIFGYMKMLDPTSVVRENEQATAANAGGVPAQIRNLYNRVTTGEMLPPESKAEILQAADQVYSEQAKNLEDYAKRYSGIATQYQLDPSRVVQQPEKYAPLSLGVGQSKDAGGGVTIKRLE